MECGCGVGIEPTTSRLWAWRATELLYPTSLKLAVGALQHDARRLGFQGRDTGASLIRFDQQIRQDGFKDAQHVLAPLDPKLLRSASINPPALTGVLRKAQEAFVVVRENKMDLIPRYTSAIAAAVPEANRALAVNSGCHPVRLFEA